MELNGGVVVWYNIVWYCMQLNGGVVVWYYIYSVVQYSVVLCGDVSSLT